MKVGVLVRVTAEQREQWKEIADREGVSVSEFVRRAVTSEIASRSV